MQKRKLERDCLRRCGARLKLECVFHASLSEVTMRRLRSCFGSAMGRIKAFGFLVAKLTRYGGKSQKQRVTSLSAIPVHTKASRFGCHLVSPTQSQSRGSEIVALFQIMHFVYALVRPDSLSEI